ncbi:MAG: PspC domain-containing protein [Dehalococcoidia bacterium]
MDHLFRSSTQRMIAGVCGGFGEYFHVDPTIVRVVYVLVTIGTGVVLGFVAYLVLWLIVPSEGAVGKDVRESMRDGVEEMAQSARDLGDRVHSTLRGSNDPETRRIERMSLAGAILLVVGIVLLLGNLDLLGWLGWNKLWPLILVAIGLFLLLRRR